MKTIIGRASSLKPKDRYIRKETGIPSSPVQEIFKEKKLRKICVSFSDGTAEFLPWDRRLRIVRWTDFLKEQNDFREKNKKIKKTSSLTNLKIAKMIKENKEFDKLIQISPDETGFVEDILLHDCGFSHWELWKL